MEHTRIRLTAEQKTYKVLSLAIPFFIPVGLLLRWLATFESIASAVAAFAFLLLGLLSVLSAWYSYRVSVHRINTHDWPWSEYAIWKKTWVWVIIPAVLWTILAKLFGL